ncbi:MAG: hypothetical protein JWO36_3636 [Myxococcales bacterium]|nr:hypothetical protein [Myxococcales bacterium]
MPMTGARSLAFAVLVACGGRSHPAPTNAFDAKGLAAELNALVSEMADAATAPNLDCAAAVTKLGEIEDHGRPLAERVRAATLDPERANQLTRELHVYDRLAVGRSDAIVHRLASCFKERPELQGQIQQVVDGMKRYSDAMQTP